MVTHVAGEDRARSAQCAPLVPDPAPVETHRRWADDTAIESFRPGLNYLLFQTAEPIIAGGALAAKAHVVPEFAKGREKGMIACSAPWVKLVSTIYASLQVHTSILGKEGPSSFRARPLFSDRGKSRMVRLEFGIRLGRAAADAVAQAKTREAP